MVLSTLTCSLTFSSQTSLPTQGTRMKTFSLELCCSLFFLLAQGAICFTEQGRQKLTEFQAKLEEKAGASSSLLQPEQSIQASETKQNGRVFYPTGYGADPTGAQESSDAIINALGDAFQAQKGLQLLPGVNDLGGVIVDLQGGNYRISKPLRFPASGGGNAVVQGGTLRASETFPGDRHLIELWSPNSGTLDRRDSIESDGFTDRKEQSGQIYYEDITFRDILFDSGYRGGGMLIVDSARIRITNCFFLHFTTQGIMVQRGHETFISTCFLGQHPTVGGDPGEKGFTGTAIELASTDNAITDTAIFSAAIGVLLRGQANIITGLHCYNKATYWGGTGILVTPYASLTRIVNCYLDYNGIVLEDPVQVHISNGLFLGGGNIVLKAINGRISGVNIVNNMFSSDPKSTIPIVSLDGSFAAMDLVVIDQNSIVGGISLKSTVAKLTVAGNSTKWVADFSSVLLFPDRITHLQYSFYINGLPNGFPVHAVTNVSDNVVVVESDRAVSALVSIAVDQFNSVGESNVIL